LGALVISDGLYRLDNACANVDGPTLLHGEGGDTALDGDIWYEYTATCTGILTVDMCLTQTGWNIDGYTGMDSMLGVYHEYDINRCDGGDQDGTICTCPDGAQRCIDAGQCPGTQCISPNNPVGCAETVGLCKNVCPCPGAFSGASPFQAGNGSDEGCDGIADAGAGIQKLTVFPDECYMIRVGAWMTAGAAPGTGNRGRGLMSVACQAQSCFPSSPPTAQTYLSSTGSTVPYKKARVLSVQGGDAGHQQALRVTWKTMPPGWESWSGQSLFAQQPVCGSEVSGVNWYASAGTCPAANKLWVSELACTPYFTDWSTYGVVNLIHEAIAPSKLVSGAGPVQVAATYDIQFVDDKCALGANISYSEALEVRTAAWGDNSELFGGGFVVPADRVTAVDLTAVVTKYANNGGPTKAAADMLGVSGGQVARLDGILNVVDTVATLGAFGSGNYYFTAADVAPPPGACPP
jgi:hypothetical protein